MGFNATAGGGNFRQVPAGNYIARCYQLIDLGHQVSEKFGSSAHKIRIGWEVFGEDDDGQPLTITRDGVTMPMTVAAEYTVSLNEKANLRKQLAAWRGRDFTAEELKGFDISKLLGAYCLLNVTTSTSSNGKTYSNVGSIAPLPKAMATNKPAGVHPLQRFDLDDPDMETFEDLPPFLQDKIKASPEWEKHQRPVQQARSVAQHADAEMDDIPF